MKLSSVALKAEKAGIYCVESGCRGILYCYAGGEYAIIRPNGYLRLTESELKVMIDELTGIKGDVEFRKRAGIRGMGR